MLRNTLETDCRRAGRRGFTLVELLGVIGIFAILISSLLPALTNAREKAFRLKCANNIRTVGQATMMYVNQSKGKVPMHRGGANWAWDLPYDTRNWFTEVAKMPQEMWYCPSYTHEMSGMWEFTGPPGPGNRESFAIAGYFWFAKRPGYQNPNGTFSPNTMTNMAWVYPEENRWIEKVTDRTVRNAPAQQVLASDIVLSNTDSRSPANKNFVQIHGGYFMGHGTSHRNKVDLPTGGNLLFLDGHVEWRNFPEMKSRLVSWPHFWF